MSITSHYLLRRLTNLDRQNRGTADSFKNSPNKLHLATLKTSLIFLGNKPLGDISRMHYSSPGKSPSTNVEYPHFTEPLRVNKAHHTDLSAHRIKNTWQILFIQFHECLAVRSTLNPSKAKRIDMPSPQSAEVLEGNGTT
jgi:hypothetical protein